MDSKRPGESRATHYFLELSLALLVDVALGAAGVALAGGLALSLPPPPLLLPSSSFFLGGMPVEDFPRLSVT